MATITGWGFHLRYRVEGLGFMASRACQTAGKVLMVFQRWYRSLHTRTLGIQKVEGSKTLVSTLG